MAAESRIGNDFKFQIGDASSPPVYTDFCATVDVGEIGEEKPLIDITTLCSNAREYRSGLADGLEIPLMVNFEPGDTQIRALYAAYQAAAVQRFRLVTKDSPEDAFEFTAIVRAWRITVPVGEKSSATFTLKITGPVVWVQS